MLYNHIKIAFRQAFKYKGYAAINLLGLVVGLVSSIPILLWVNDELGMDKFHAKSDRIYQAFRNMYQGSGAIETTPGVPQPLEELIRDEYADVENVAIFSWEIENLFRLGEKTSYESGRFASPEFFEIFSFPFVAGNPATALNDVHSVVISEKLAEKYFGDDWASTALGQLIRIDERAEFSVTGVFRNPGEYSSLQFDWIIPAREYIQRNSWVNDWGSGGFRLYLTLKEGAAIDDVRKRVEHEVNNHTDYDADERVVLQKFTDNYLHSKFENGVPAGGRIQYVRILSVVAVFILIIACINFMNLATARSSMRAKEIGVRKVLGAQKASLSKQFFVESFLNSIISVALALLIVTLSMPYFSEMFGKSLTIDFTSFSTWIALAGIILITGLLSGSYPALLLSSFKIISSLKGLGRQGSGGTYFRHGLATFQFAISILLITGTLVISQQMDYVMHKNLGLDRENMVMIRLEGELRGRHDVLLTELQKIPEVKDVTFTSGNPLSYGRSTGGASWEGKDPDNQVEINVLGVGSTFFETMGIEIAQGTGFSDDYKTDSARFLVNEVLAGIMGFETTVGKQLSFWGTTGEIIGVVRNFHMDSMHEPIAPLIILYAPRYVSLAMIRTQNNTQNALQDLEHICRKLNPSYPFRYEFMDDAYAESYKSETALISLFNFLAMVAIFISCLGLFGLSSFSADRRSKEIGIRKVHGASVSHLVLTLSRDYAILMLIALVIAAPIAYVYLGSWLSSFAFRIDLKLTFFVAAGLLAFAIGIITVSFKSWQAATVNPVKTLRDE